VKEAGEEAGEEEGGGAGAGESDSPQGEFKLDNSAASSATSEPRPEESLKLMYRKIVRRLHPDLHGENEALAKENLGSRAKGLLGAQSRGHRSSL